MAVHLISVSSSSQRCGLYLAVRPVCKPKSVTAALSPASYLDQIFTFRVAECHQLKSCLNPSVSSCINPLTGEEEVLVVKSAILAYVDANGPELKPSCGPAVRYGDYDVHHADVFQAFVRGPV